MYRSAKYPTSETEAEEFVAGQRHGYLIATPPGGHPQVSILPFVKRGDEIELHCVQEDPTFAAVRANPLVTFLVSDFLAFSRHDWVDPRDGGRATLNFRAVAYSCEATTSTDPANVAAALARLLATYEPARATSRSSTATTTGRGCAGWWRFACACWRPTRSSRSGRRRRWRSSGGWSPDCASGPSRATRARRTRSRRHCRGARGEGRGAKGEGHRA